MFESLFYFLYSSPTQDEFLFYQFRFQKGELISPTSDLLKEQTLRKEQRFFVLSETFAQIQSLVHCLSRTLVISSVSCKKNAVAGSGTSGETVQPITLVKTSSNITSQILAAMRYCDSLQTGSDRFTHSFIRFALAEFFLRPC